MFAATKFQAPPARAQHVPRSRCLDKANGLLGGRHLLVCAPAGSGKSTFAAQWAASFERSAWVSLAEDDDEPGQFWSALIGGIGAVAPGVGAGELGPLIAGGDVDAVLVRLVSELTDLGELAIVLDDLHLITDEECHAGLAWMLEHAPRTLHIGLCTRTTPPLPLDRLIAHGEIGVVSGSELVFDEGEAQEFLRERLGLAVEPAAVSTIVERTEGWAAGIYLAALSLRTGTPSTVIPAGGDRRVRGYLLAEVLDALDPGRLQFLEEVSVLDRFSGPMCDQVLGRIGSATLIEELERSNLFVIPLDTTGTWFRLHHLFAELLRERLAARGAGEVERLYARAADWHLQHDEITEAIVALVRAGQPEAAAELVATHHVRYLNRSRLGATVARWLDLLPSHLVTASAPLCLCRAWVAGANGRTHELEAWLERAAALPHEGPLPDGCACVEAEIELIRACFAFADHRAVLRHARAASELDRPESGWWPLIQLVVGLGEYRVEGPTDAAVTALTRAVESATAPEHAITAAIAPGVLAAIHAGRDERAEAEAAIEMAEAARAKLGVERVPQAAVSWWSTSRAHLALGRVQEAARDAEAGVAATAEVAPEHDATMVVPPCLIQLARVRLAEGRDAEARDLLAQARERLRWAPDPGRLREWLEETERSTRRTVPDLPGVEPLSDRELAVLRRLAGNASLRDIGADLSVSLNTMKSHARSIYRKLGVTSRDEAVERGRELGFLS